jgi:two-component system, LuxR family, sensor kinase FixL
MSWITIIWSMVSSACLTLAAVNLLVWCKKRTAWANLLFSITAVGTAGMAFCELWMMRAETPGQFGTALRWLHVPAWALLVALVGFVRLYLRAGRPWLAWSFVGLRTFSLLLDFLVGQNLNYLEITGLRHIPFFGESVSVAQGVANRCMLVGQLSLLLLVLFVADATVTVWRRGDRRQALAVGGSIVFFTVAGTVQAVLVLWEMVHWPMTASFFYLGIVATMAYEMSHEALRAAQLSDDLRESEERMTLAAEAAGFGVWMWSIARNQIWGSERWLGLFGLAPDAAVAFEDVIQRIHPDDREGVESAMRRAVADRSDYAAEYRVVLPDNTQRWVAARGRAYPDTQGKPVRMMGATIDITERHRAEAAARELGGRLINAQEDERRRMARDLHDDLSQRLALISVELDMFGQQPPVQPEVIAGRMQELSREVESMASDVHRLAHQLHPAKLEQLGLAATVRGFCKELAAAHQIAIHFESHDVSRALPDDVALCLYRITQEALQNAIKHSGATGAKVELAANERELHLTVTDDGHGFDPEAIDARGSLGIVSMRERARMVRGRISVQSHPGEGTRIEVRVPIPPPAAEPGELHN